MHKQFSVWRALCPILLTLPSSISPNPKPSTFLPSYNTSARCGQESCLHLAQRPVPSRAAVTETHIHVSQLTYLLVTTSQPRLLQTILSMARKAFPAETEVSPDHTCSLPTRSSQVASGFWSAPNTMGQPEG